MEKLKVGDKAPSFSMVDSQGKQHKLEDYNKLVLYFYPRDNTPGCTAQACSLTNDYSKLKEAGYDILGVSGDSEASHNRFINRYSIPYALLVDSDKELCNLYGVYGEKKFMGRTSMGIIRSTFIIENGIITHIIDKATTKTHGAQILAII